MLKFLLLSYSVLSVALLFTFSIWCGYLSFALYLRSELLHKIKIVAFVNMDSSTRSVGNHK